MVFRRLLAATSSIDTINIMYCGSLFHRLLSVARSRIGVARGLKDIYLTSESHAVLSVVFIICAGRHLNLCWNTPRVFCRKSSFERRPRHEVLDSGTSTRQESLTPSTCRRLQDLLAASITSPRHSLAPSIHCPEHIHTSFPSQLQR